MISPGGAVPPDVHRHKVRRYAAGRYPVPGKGSRVPSAAPRSTAHYTMVCLCVELVGDNGIVELFLEGTDVHVVDGGDGIPGEVGSGKCRAKGTFPVPTSDFRLPDFEK